MECGLGVRHPISLAIRRVLVMKWIWITGLLVCGMSEAEELPAFEEAHKLWLLQQAVDGFVEKAIEDNRSDIARPDIAIVSVHEHHAPGRVVIWFPYDGNKLRTHQIIPGAETLKLEKVDLGMAFAEVVAFIDELSKVEQEPGIYKGGITGLTLYYSVDMMPTYKRIDFPKQDSLILRRLTEGILNPDKR